MTTETPDNIHASALASLEITGFANAVRGTNFEPWPGTDEPTWRTHFGENLQAAQALAAVWMDDPEPSDNPFDLEDPSGAFLSEKGFQQRSLRFRLQGMLTNIWSWATTYETYLNGALKADGTRNGGLRALIVDIKGADEVKARAALRNYKIGIGRIRLRAQAHKQTALEAVEDLTTFHESLKRVADAFSDDFRTISSKLADSDSTVADLQRSVADAENARLEAQRALVMAGLETAVGVLGIIGGGAAIMGGVALLLSPDPAASKVAGVAALVGGGTALVTGIAMTSMGGVSVAGAKAAEKAAEDLKALLDTKLTETQALGAAMQLLQNNITELSRACQRGLTGARALLSGWENLDERLGSLQLASFQVEPDGEALDLLEQEWGALKDKTESLRELHDIPVETVEGVPGTEPQAA